MTNKKHTFDILNYDDLRHRKEVICLWKEVFNYPASHNKPELVIEKKLEVGDGLFWVAVQDLSVVGTIMAGYDGHRGWIYSLAVLAKSRQQGIGSALLHIAEKDLISRGCDKINLQILEDNEQVKLFYQAHGFSIEKRISMGKRI